MDYGLYVVRAHDEEQARRIAFSGPAVEDADPAQEYGIEWRPDADVKLLESDGDEMLVAFHYG